MISYPKQLITSLCEQLPENLTKFFEIEHVKFFHDFDDMNAIIDSTLRDYLNNETSVSDVRLAQIRMRRQKKNRWMNLYKKNINDKDITDYENPFFPIYQAFNIMNGRTFLNIYSATDVETAIENQKRTIDEWASNKNSFLVDFPLISSKTKNQVRSSFKVDLIVSLTEIIMDSLDGDIGSYFTSKPTILLENPFFAPSKHTVPVSQALDSYIANLVDFDAEDMVFQMLVSSDPNNADDIKKVKVFDPRDNQILLTLINNIRMDFYGSKQLVVDVGSIAKSINSRPNSHLYEDVKLRVHNMARTGFRLCKKETPNDPVFTFTLFDNVKTINQEGKEFLAITFGDTLFDAITKKRMISVTSSNYNLLDMDMSKLLYHHLQKERISLSTSSVPNEDGLLHKSYDYSYFQRIILFRKKKKKENIQLISDALREFVSKSIALADFSYDTKSGLFNLYYFPLSDDEKADLNSMIEGHEEDYPLLEFLSEGENN